MNRLLDKEHLPVYLRTLLVDTVSSFNIYIKVKKDKMVLYHSGGDKFTREVRDNLLNNKVNIVYIKREDQEEYIDYLEKNLSGILADKKLECEKKAEIAHLSVSSIAKEFFKHPRAQTVQRYKHTIHSMMDFVMKEEGAIRNLILLTSYDFTTYVHSVNVGVFSIGLAKSLLAGDPSHDMKELASGFFLHDIGKCRIPLKILHKRGTLTKDEWEVMRRHPELGYELLEELNVLTKEAKIIVMQHHERQNGRGYPKGLKGDKIHIYSKICSIADVFEALTSRRPYKQRLSAFEALKIMRNDMREEFDPHFFSKFILLFSEKNIEPPKEKLMDGFNV